MKFSVKSVISTIPNCQTRVGLLSDIERLQGKTFETPLLLLHTKGGSVPHMTREVLQLISQDSHPVQIPLTSFIHFQEGVKDFKNGVPKFIGLQEYLTYMTVQDPAEKTPQGYNDKNFISIWSHMGRKQLSANSFMDIIETFHPDMFEVLSDGDTSLKSSAKRSVKSVNTSLTMLNTCIERHKKSEILKNSGMLGVIAGGYSLEARATCSKTLANASLLGVVINGLHNNGEEAESLTFQDVQPVVEESLKYLPTEMLRIMHGRWKPDVLLKLVKSGIDLFDSSLVYAVTERGCAFNFKYHRKTINENDICCKGQPEQMEQQSFEMCLNEKRYFDDFSPIDERCSCLTCKKHSRSYIHHLLNTKEMLAQVLLMIHNLNYYLEFFEFIRNNAKLGYDVELCYKSNCAV